MTDLALAGVAVLCLLWWRFRDKTVGLKPWRICSWCDDVVEFGDEGGFETHTFCARCLEKWNTEVDKSPRIAA